MFILQVSHKVWWLLDMELKIFKVWVDTFIVGSVEVTEVDMVYL